MATETTDQSNPALDLDALVNGSTIRIKGRDYPLLRMSQMPPRDRHRFVRLANRSDTLLDQTDLTPEEDDELGAIPDRMCRLVLQAPDDVHAALTDVERSTIVDTFMMLPPTARPGRQSQLPGAPSPIGETPLPGSVGSTAEAR